MEMNRELLEKAKQAESTEELIALAKENGMEMTGESANAYLDLLHSQNSELAYGELADDELDNVAGGCFGEHYDNRIKVSPTDRPCIYYACEICEQAFCGHHSSWAECTCGNCLHIRYDSDGVTHCNSVNVAKTGKLY